MEISGLCDGIQGISRSRIAVHPGTVDAYVLTRSHQAFPRRAVEKVPLENWFVGYFLDAWLNTTWSRAWMPGQQQLMAMPAGSEDPCFN